MASSVVVKQMLSSKLLTRSFRRPAVATALRHCDGGRHHCDVANRRGFATNSFFKGGLSIMRRLGRLSKRVDQSCHIVTREIKPAKTKEDAECLCFYLHMSQVKEEDVKVSVKYSTVYIEGKDFCNFIKYICWIDLPDIDLPDKIYKTTDIKAEMRVKTGELQLTVPKLKKEDIVCNVEVKII